MHELSYFRGNLDAIAARLATRGYELDVASFRELDQERRLALTESETLKAQRNTESAGIAKLKESGEDTADRQAKVRAIGDRIKELENTAKAVDERFYEVLAGVPNIPLESVPADPLPDTTEDTGAEALAAETSDAAPVAPAENSDDAPAAESE